MSILRSSAVAALVAGAALAVPSAAFASAASPAAAPASVHQVHCTSNTFNVYRGFGETCYAGTGAGPTLTDVYRITTGRYWGCMETRSPQGGILQSGFGPHRTIRLPGDTVSFRLANKPPICPL